MMTECHGFMGSGARGARGAWSRAQRLAGLTGLGGSVMGSEARGARGARWLGHGLRGSRGSWGSVTGSGAEPYNVKSTNKISLQFPAKIPLQPPRKSHLQILMVAVTGATE